MKGDGLTVLTIIHIYASLERLVQSLARESLRKTELVLHFIRGFNSISGTMDFVDIGDEGGLMSEKMTGLFLLESFISLSKDQIQSFLALPACRFMILGLDNSEAYNDFFSSVANRDSPHCEICLLRPPFPEVEEDDQRWMHPKFRFSQSSLKGLFVPKSSANRHRLSYVDIVKHASPKANANKTEDPISSIIPRKVSNASTISTQADEEWSDESKEFESKPSRDFRNLCIRMTLRV